MEYITGTTWLATINKPKRKHVARLEPIAFEGVATAAEHLEVLRHGLAAFRPRHDVIALHLPVIKMSMANRTDALLQLVGSRSISFRARRSAVQHGSL